MRKWKILIIVLMIVVILALILFAFIIPIVIGSQNKISYRTFTDLAEIERYSRTNFEIGQEDLADHELGNLRTIDSFCCEYRFKGKTYRLYAYVFSSMEDAKTYFENRTGKVSEGLSENFSLSSNTYFSTEFTSFQDCNAWHLDGGGFSEFCEMYTALSEAL